MFQKNFVVEKYMDKQPEITKTMRAILVDWMVEVQVQQIFIYYVEDVNSTMFNDYYNYFS